MLHDTKNRPGIPPVLDTKKSIPVQVLSQNTDIQPLFLYLNKGTKILMDDSGEKINIPQQSGRS